MGQLLSLIERPGTKNLRVQEGLAARSAAEQV